MQMEHVTDSVAIYSDGTNLQVIHDLGTEFVLDFKLEKEPTFNIDVLGKTDYAYHLKPFFIDYVGQSCNFRNLSNT